MDLEKFVDGHVRVRRKAFNDIAYEILHTIINEGHLKDIQDPLL